MKSASRASASRFSAGGGVEDSAAGFVFAPSSDALKTMVSAAMVSVAMGRFDCSVDGMLFWESFGTDEMPNVGDLIASADYKDGYIRFSTPENFRDGNAVIAAKNSKGTIPWSWHMGESYRLFFGYA